MSRAEPDRASARAASAPSSAPGSVPSDLATTTAALFGPRLPLAVRYAELLVTEGVLRGLIGPRESPRIWDRHLLNCAAITELIPSDSYVVDVGSGAGLPGIVLAVARPDLQVVLVESLARRVAFLHEVVEHLHLDRVAVVRGRAEECAGRLRPADVVTARAVASLDRLSAWCLPLARTGGALLAMKGASAREEVAEHRESIRRRGGGDPVVHTCGAGLLDDPVTVVEIRRAAAGADSSRSAAGVSRASSERRAGARSASAAPGGAARGGVGGAARGGAARDGGGGSVDRDCGSGTGSGEGAGGDRARRVR